MQLGLDSIMTLLLIVARLLPLFLTPSMSPLARVPMTVRIHLLIVIALLVLVNTSVQGSALPTSWEALGFAVIREFILGVALAFGLQILFSGLSFAGRIIDLQIGFGAAGIIDPMTKNSEALIGTLLTMLGIMVFFASDTHYLLIEVTVASLGVIPVGGSMINFSIMMLVAEFSMQLFYGILVVLPVIVGLLMLDVVIAFSSRSMPQMNIYFVSLPVKIFIGFFLLLASINIMNSGMNRMFNQLHVYWGQILQ